VTTAPDLIRIRKVRRADAPRLLSLIDALADFEKLDRPSPAARKRLTRDCSGRGKRFHAFLAFSGRRAVGYAIFFETYSSFLALPTLYLEDLFVLPDERGRGTGRKLFRACLDEARRRGCGRMEWVVLDWNIRAIRFYRGMGARHLRRWHTYRLDRKQFDRLLSRP